MQQAIPSTCAYMAAAILLSGCSTYVNIPSQVGDVADNNPNALTVREVEIEVISGMLAEEGIDTKYQIRLPEGTSPVHYNMVTTKLGDNAKWLLKGPQEALPLIDVRQIRVRGWYAQVDLIRPSSFRQADGPRQLATAWLRWYPGIGWRYQRLQMWSIGVHEALEEAPRQAERTMEP